MRLLYPGNKKSVKLSLGQALCGYFMFKDCLGIITIFGLWKPSKAWEYLADETWYF